MVELTISDEFLLEVQRAVSVHQPELDISLGKETIILDGQFVVSGPQGPFDSYRVGVEVPASFPWDEPSVSEIGGRIPKVADRHVNPDSGNCCLGIWEEWLLTAPDHSFETFLTGVMHDYFVGQTCYEAKGEWPYGERSHGDTGVLESFADLLGVANNATIVIDHLRLLSKAQVKGHLTCPCGSGRRLRHCHRDKVEELRNRVPPVIAARMFNRILPKTSRGSVRAKSRS